MRVCAVFTERVTNFVRTNNDAAIEIWAKSEWKAEGK